jgi:tetratricopeptide (TPR) repeat protein
MATVKKSTSVKTVRKNPTKSKRGGRESSSMRWFPPVCVTVLTFLTFLPVLQNGFVNWDDALDFTENSHYRGLGWSQLRWMFTTFHVGQYRPVTWMTFGLDYLLWGMAPVGYHLTSLLFHCAGALVFYFVALHLLRLTLPATKSATALSVAAAFAALFFSLHPLRVEPVAWASARGDIISLLLLLLTTVCYLRAVAAAGDPSQYRRWLVASLLLYAVSLLAKVSGMSFPFVLLALDVYPLRRLGFSSGKWFSSAARRVWWEKIPFLLLAIAAGVVGVIAKREGEVLYSIEKYGLWVRIAESFYGLVFYLWKTVLPLSLSPLYQRPEGSNPAQWFFWLSAGAVLAISFALFAVRRRRPAGLALWAYYIVTLAPVLGIEQFGPQMVADRYSYFASLGWALLAGAILMRLSYASESGGSSPARLNFVRLTAAAWLFVLGYLTWQQTQVWRDSARLWRHAVMVDPSSSYAYINLAAALKEQGNVDESIRYYRKAASLRPDLALTHQSLGDLFLDRGDLDEAIRSYQRVLEIDPKSVKGYQRLAAAMAKKGRREESVTLYLKALQLAPKDAAVYNDLGNALVTMGQLDRAIEYYRNATEFESTRREPYFNLGNLMVQQDRLDQAIGYYQQALKVDPDYLQAHNNLGRVLAAQGKLEEAVAHFRQAVRIDPNFMAARESLVLALDQQGKKSEASREYAEAMKLLEARGLGKSP